MFKMATQEDYEDMAAHSQIAGMAQKNASEAAQYYLEEKEKGIIDVQLEVDSIKTDIYHLLKQDKIVFDEESQKINYEVIDESKRTLTEWGVERLMQVIHFYINKNTLLTNFDAAQIQRIMLTFMREINDLVLLKYEYLFRQPTLKECKEILEEKIAYKKSIRRLTSEFLGKEIDEEEVTKDIMKEFEQKIESEIQKIKEKKIEENIREYGLMIAQLEIIVYATLNRAFRGEERGSIRRHTQISELIGTKTPLPHQSKGGIFSWGSK